MLACFSQEPIDDWVYKRRQGPEEYAKEHGEALALLEKEFASALDTALKGFSESLYERVDGVAKGWSADRRKDLLVRYLGFPFWDILLYPIQSISDAGERDAINIVRMSPKDVKLLPPLATPKLSGVGIMHFGAFFDRAGRESDYLWGRLDGAERMIGLLLGRNATKQDRVEWCRKAFAAIVAEEEAALPNAKPLLDHARNFGGE